MRSGRDTTVSLKISGEEGPPLEKDLRYGEESPGAFREGALFRSQRFKRRKGKKATSVNEGQFVKGSRGKWGGRGRLTLRKRAGDN